MPSLPRPGSNSKRARAVTEVRVLTGGAGETGGCCREASSGLEEEERSSEGGGSVDMMG